MLLLHDVAAAANEATRARQALTVTLERICRAHDWAVGHVYVLRDQPEERLRPSIWRCSEPDRFRSFRRLTGDASFRVGEGMVGKVAAECEPLWIEDVARCSPPVRITDAPLEVTSGLLVPIVVRSRPSAAAVLEFYSAERRATSPVRLRLATSVSSLLARVFEREYLEHRLVVAHEDEQRRIGRELHDTISQELTGITMMAERLTEDAEERQSPLAEKLETLTEHIRRVRGEVHALARGLLPVEVTGVRLRSALEALAENVREMYGVDCRLHWDDEFELDTGVANHIARIAQEAIQNSAKHGHADSVSMRLSRQGRTVSMTVQDNGKGFSPGKGEGVGLRLMHYRASAIGADLTIQSQPGRGTQVRCTWKL